MAVILKSTKGAKTHGVKAIVYGFPGVGKTTLIRTLPNPVILSAEAGLLSLTESDIPYLEIKSMDDLADAFIWLTTTDEGKRFDTICLDSISEIAEVCLSEEKRKTKDGRQSYGALAEIINASIRAFRDIPEKNVFFIAKCEKEQDENGRMLYGPSMPGKSLTQSIGYFFDLLLALRAEKDAEGNVVRALMTETDGLWQAKARGFKLEPWEPADLGAIIRKVKGV